MFSKVERITVFNILKALDYGAKCSGFESLMKAGTEKLYQLYSKWALFTNHGEIKGSERRRIVSCLRYVRG